jgi:hypothetical protein
MYVWMAGRQAADCERDYMIRYTCAKMSYFLFGANCISSLDLAACSRGANTFTSIDINVIHGSNASFYTSAAFDRNNVIRILFFLDASASTAAAAAAAASIILLQRLK